MIKKFVLLSLLILPLSAQEDPPKSDSTGYTINYNTVSIVEYIRFASRVCNVNFIYDVGDLNFSVSVLSDAPITPENVMGTLVQVLRIHGLRILEQDHNLVIHKSADVNQIATLVTGKNDDEKAPIVTRVFRVANAKPESLAAIIRPMISTEALLEVSVETRQLIITDVTTNVNKVASLIEILDSPHAPLDIQSYEPSNNRLDFLIETANQIMAPMTQGNPFILVPQPLAGSIFVVSTPDLVNRAISVLKTLDSPPKENVKNQKKITTDNMLIYSAVNRTGGELLHGLQSIGENISQSGVSEGDLKETIDSGKFIPQTNTLMFIGSIYSIAKVKEFLTALDTTPKFGEESFFIYKPIYRDAKELEKAILEIGRNLKAGKDSNRALVNTIENVKVNPLTNTLLFSGDSLTFGSIREMLASMDAQSDTSGKSGAQNNFFVYKIQHAPYTAVESSLKYFADQISNPNISEEGLIDAIRNMKYIAETNSILFTGPDTSLKRLQDLVPTFDQNISFPPVNNQFFIYKPKNVNDEALLHSIREVTEDLKKNQYTDPAFLQAVQNVKWMKANGSLLFTGDSASIKKVEDLIGTLDVTEIKTEQRSYYIYKLQNTTADIIEEDIDNLVKSFKASGVRNPKLLYVIENMRHVKETNSFLLTGDPAAIEEAKALLAEYDYPRAKSKSAQSNFLMIKPQNTTPAQLEKSLREVALNLKKADLADPNLLTAIDSIKYIDATNSLLFTGTPEALARLQALVKDLDVPMQAVSPIQHIGKTSFLLYKIKNGTSTQVLSSIKALAADLKKSGAGEKEFITSLQTAKYIRETHSILFTGPEDALQKVEEFASQFDVIDSCGPKATNDDCPVLATNFYVYKPVALSGPDLETITNDFAENLKLSGLSDPELFSTISSMRWVEPSQSLIFTGTPKALDQVKQLIISFDVPGNIPVGTNQPQEPSIQGIDNTNFLVYKLQYHKGDEIQGALRQIAKDLIASSAPVNASLLNAINTIQWIQITNSLLCSGDQQTLSRLRDLIKSLDVPLKQVFIEMLVIETNLLNALEFGLEWGGKYKYRNKFQGSINNIMPPPGGGNCQIPEVLNTLNNLDPKIPMPTLTNQIPFGCGFDLGIIGQVIKHNGETFLSLGSLLTALQNDDQTAVIVTPKIITQDGRPANFFSGANVPFVGSFVNTNGQNTVQTSNIEYRDIGLNLTVTPIIGNSDVLTLDIELDRSQTLTDLQGTSLNFSNTSANGIITSKTRMQTTVNVPDKSFLILSGFINNSNVKSSSGIPCLGGLPLIGAAFSKDTNTMNNQNIVIFLRPHIINSFEDLRRVTENQEDAFRDQQGTPFLLHQFDEGMELIKCVDDD